jgi:hypothetical protein
MNIYFPVKDFLPAENQSSPAPPPDRPADALTCDAIGDSCENAVWGD